jgi:isopenicillin N synthase-like dioxygenase
MMDEQSSIKTMTSDARLGVLDARLLDGSAADRRCFIERLREECYDVGAFYLAHHSVPAALCEEVLDGSRAFFDLPLEDKIGINIRKSEHFRGYSDMSNGRDWREQVHLGLEQPKMACEPDAPAPWRLRGPNLWPARLGVVWRATMLSFLSGVGALGHRLLAALAMAAKLPEGHLNHSPQDTPYLLMKLICYYSQSPGKPFRDGVAPHCDWSLLTFLLQREAGLQVQTRRGQWLDVPPISDTLVVNLGELMEVVTSGHFYATPHRVRNASCDKPRISIPVFINPGLHSVIAPVPMPDDSGGSLRSGPIRTVYGDPTPHIHRVVDPGKPITPFVFGDSEWQRKGLGRWCYEPGCCDS